MFLASKKIFYSIRQLFYPKEFRIPDSSSYPEVNRLVEGLKHLQAKISAGTLKDETVIQLGDTIWRSQKNLCSFMAQDTSGGLRRVIRLLKETNDILKEANIEVRDYTGERYVNGMVTKRLTTQPCTEEIRKNCLISRPCDSKLSSDGWIIETIKPGIFRNGHLIRIGEIIVCQPPEEIKGNTER